MHLARLIILLFSGILFTPVLVLAQTGVQERTANLRAQLSDVQLKQTELQTRLEQLEFDLKPENIEHSLAGIGSTHPEELREQRRRQLDGEKTRVLAQLAELATTRTRLEAAIVQADTESYRQSAGTSASAGANVYHTPTRTQPRVGIATSRNRAPSARRHRVRRHRRQRRVAR